MGVYNYESIGISDTATGFTAAVLAAANTLFGRDTIRATCTVETAQIRFRVDGTDPTSSEGHILEIGDVLYVDKQDVSKFSAIRTGATSGVLKVSYDV